MFFIFIAECLMPHAVVCVCHTLIKFTCLLSHLLRWHTGIVRCTRERGRWWRPWTGRTTTDRRREHSSVVLCQPTPTSSTTTLLHSVVSTATQPYDNLSLSPCWTVNNSRQLGAEQTAGVFRIFFKSKTYIMVWSWPFEVRNFENSGYYWQLGVRSQLESKSGARKINNIAKIM